MPEMLRLQQRGENIYYTPLSENRHPILIDAMTREYTATEVQRQKARPRPVPVPASSGNSGTAYYAHYENIRTHLNVEDFSRVDAMIALRLRTTGHSQQAVTEAVCLCAPTIREKNESRDWQRYAERTAGYAFGVADDVALAKNERYVEHWRRIEGFGEREQEVPRVRMR